MAAAPSEQTKETHQLSADDRAAFTNARIAALKAGLELSPTQEKNWPALETELREVAQARQPFIRVADRFALLLLPVALGVAGAAWVLSGDPIRGLAVLVAATPCPLILAAPVAFRRWPRTLGGVSTRDRHCSQIVARLVELADEKRRDV